MSLKKFVKAFVAGMVFPGIFLPLAYTLLYVMDTRPIPTRTLEFVPMYLPIIWGFANAIFMHLHEGSSVKRLNAGLWVTGACLGFLVAVCGVFILNLPTIVFGELNGLEFVPLIILPVIYGAVFRYIVKWFNKMISV